MEINFKNLKKILAANNYQLTFQRKLILQVFLSNQEKHLSAEEIYNNIKNKNPSIGLSTVYRTLEVFSNSGVIKELDFDTNCRRYELKGKNIHHHLICVECDKITEFSEEMLEKIESHLYKKYKFQVTEHKIKFYGYCDECQ
ncbi:Fur family transcriptional regulator [Halanaerocella petrolearia]